MIYKIRPNTYVRLYDPDVGALGLTELCVRCDHYFCVGWRAILKKQKRWPSVSRVRYAWRAVQFGLPPHAQRDHIRREMRFAREVASQMRRMSRSCDDRYYALPKRPTRGALKRKLDLIAFRQTRAAGRAPVLAARELLS